MQVRVHCIKIKYDAIDTMERTFRACDHVNGLMGNMLAYINYTTKLNVSSENAGKAM